MEVIDCLPGVPPPYSAEQPATSSGLTRACRSQSVEHILESGDLDSSSKMCCDTWTCRLCSTSCLRFRCVLLMLSAAGLCSTLGGVIIGIIRVPETSYLTLSLMFAGLGILLFLVMCIGWRCTPSDHEPCHLLFGLGSYSMVQRTHFSRRSRARYHWIGGRLFPEFRYRRPPPSYTISMQEYQNHIISLGVIPQTPPPTYKNITTRLARQMRSGNNASTSAENNQPPSYAEISEQQEAISTQPEADCADSNIDSISTTDQSYNEPGGVDNPSYSADEESITSNHIEPRSTSENISDTDNHEQPDRPSSPTSFYEVLGEVTHL